MANHAQGFGSIIILQEGLPEASLAIRHPHRLLGIIRLQHVISLHLHGDNEVWGRIWIRFSGLSELDVARHGGV